jgi:hypothetical protein
MSIELQKETDAGLSIGNVGFCPQNGLVNQNYVQSFLFHKIVNPHEECMQHDVQKPVT